MHEPMAGGIDYVCEPLALFCGQYCFCFYGGKSAIKTLAKRSSRIMQNGIRHFTVSCLPFQGKMGGFLSPAADKSL
jgi:hypothetical protein